MKIKIYFNLDDNIDNAGTESLWAEQASGESAIIDNVPFHVNGVSLGDEVAYKEKGGLYCFHKLLKRSGHSTYRILQLGDEQKKRFEEFWKPIEVLGASYESKIDNDRILYAVDIPDRNTVAQIYELLSKGEAQRVWNFEEANYVK